MKGLEETLTQTIFLIGAILAAVILIYMASQYLGGLGKDTRLSEGGDKTKVLSEIKNIAGDCWDDFGGRKTAEVCSKTYLNETKNISSQEIYAYLKNSKVPADFIIAENITGPAEIVVAYRDSLIFIEER